MSAPKCNTISRPDPACATRPISGPAGYFFEFINLQVKRSCTDVGGDLQCESDLGEKRLRLKSLDSSFKRAGSRGIKTDVGASFHWLHTAQPDDRQQTEGRSGRRGPCADVYFKAAALFVLGHDNEEHKEPAEEFQQRADSVANRAWSLLFSAWQSSRVQH